MAHWLDTTSDELLGQLRVLNGFNIDIAADVPWVTSRHPDLLVSLSPALERAIGPRLPSRRPGDDREAPDPHRVACCWSDPNHRTIKNCSLRLADKVTATATDAPDAPGRVLAKVAAELDRLHT